VGTLSIAEAANLARSVGLSGEQVVTAVAIAIAESNLNADAVGDVSLQNTTWGPSIGLWQIRSVKAEKGTGRSRDASRLKDPVFNARAMFQISGGGKNWTPWSTYKNGAYRQHLNKVRRQAGAASGSPKPSGSIVVGFGETYQNPDYFNADGSRKANPTVSTGNGSGGVQRTDFDLPGPDALYGLGGMLGEKLLNKGGDVLDEKAAELRSAVLVALIWTAALGLGTSLVLIGTWATVRNGAGAAS
jgi:hypothetical protein